MDPNGKQMGFDIIAVRMRERLETMVSGYRRKRKRARHPLNGVTSIDSVLTVGCFGVS